MDWDTGTQAQTEFPPEDTPTPIAATFYSSSQEVESLLHLVPAFHTLETLQSCVPGWLGVGAHLRGFQCPAQSVPWCLDIC